MKPLDHQQLADFAAPILAGLGYELVEIEWKSEAGHRVLRVFIDFLPSQEPGGPGEAGGEARHISHEDCTRASRALGAELDVADLIQSAFNLEVSSPGLNRPLKHEADFRRFTGQKAKIRTRAPLAGTVTEQSPGRRNFAGPIIGVEAGRVRIKAEGTIFEIPVAEVEKANLVFEF